MTVNTNGPEPEYDHVTAWREGSDGEYPCEGAEMGICSGGTDNEPHAEDCPSHDQRWDSELPPAVGGIAPESSYHGS